jgi:uncharacterized protein YndB with AHSA1/START domain
MTTAQEAASREIIITRVFDAPRAHVFKAWTDPKHVEKWWGPKGFTSRDCEIDLRVGGVFRLQMDGPDGTVYPCTGVYREIVEPERLVFASTASDGPACGAGLPPRSIVTVTFAEHAGKTTLTIHTRLESAADREAAEKAGVQPGWAATLERLADFLAPACATESMENHVEGLS